MIARLARLTPEQRGLLAEAVAALAGSSVAVAVVPFRRVMRLVRRPGGDDHVDEAAAVLAVRWAVTVAARRVPWRAKCLEQALAANWMLARRGVGATVFYGINRASKGLQAHAWVRTATHEVIGCENAAEFTELARFP
jgi:hypothetical protein